MSDKRKWKYDADYISYVESGESAAVFIVRDIVNSIDTGGKWIDVVSIDTYPKARAKNRIAFNWMVVELFQRKIEPVYPEYSHDAERKYITWKTADEDISEQRKNGVRGPMYLVLCDLCNTGKVVYIPVVVHGVSSAFEYSEIKGFRESEWKYAIRAVKKVNQKQVDYIESHRNNIVKLILENKKPKLEFFGLEPDREKPSRKQNA